jgi:hypothetical protein
MMRIHQVPRLITKLYATVNELSSLFPDRPFTPDGHLVGSIGEVVAAYIYDLELKRPSNQGFDAQILKSRETVEVKLTSRTQINISEQDTYADVLIVLRLVEGRRFEEVYAGPFPRDFIKTRTFNKRKFTSVAISSLRELNRHCYKVDGRIAELNQSFVDDHDQ